jgi:hypothetical protein
MTQQFNALPPGFRPDLIGGIVGIRDDGSFAQAFYFTSEAQARAGEQQEIPAEFSDRMAEEQALTSQIRFLDVPQPWFYSPR